MLPVHVPRDCIGWVTGNRGSSLRQVIPLLPGVRQFSPGQSLARRSKRRRAHSASSPAHKATMNRYSSERVLCSQLRPAMMMTTNIGCGAEVW